MSVAPSEKMCFLHHFDICDKRDHTTDIDPFLFGKKFDISISGKYAEQNEQVFTDVLSRLVIGTSRTVGSAKKFVRITSGFGGGEFTKTLRKVCTCQKLKFAFLLLEYCKSENAMLWRMLSRLETCIVYCCI